MLNKSSDYETICPIPISSEDYLPVMVIIFIFISDNDFNYPGNLG